MPPELVPSLILSLQQGSLAALQLLLQVHVHEHSCECVKGNRFVCLDAEVGCLPCTLPEPRSPGAQKASNIHSVYMLL